MIWRNFAFLRRGRDSMALSHSAVCANTVQSSMYTSFRRTLGNFRSARSALESTLAPADLTGWPICLRVYGYVHVARARCRSLDDPASA